MSDATAFGFGKFIPGFDFLQGLTKAGQGAGVPPVSSWIAPTVSVEELDKRIAELKAVQYWLEQNGRALAATVQALEVQKLTLNTLQGMNVSMSEVAKAFTGQAGAAGSSASASGRESAPASGAYADWPMSAAASSASKKEAASAHAERSGGIFGSKSAQETAAPQEPPSSDASPAAGNAASTDTTREQHADAADGPASSGTAAGMGVDPMLWWGALTQQFQHIAAQALQDPAQQQAMVQATHMATDFTKAAMQAASDMVRSATVAAQGAAATAPSPAKSTRSTAAKKASSGSAKAGGSRTPQGKPSGAAKASAKPSRKATGTASKAAAKAPARKAAGKSVTPAGVGARRATVARKTVR